MTECCKSCIHYDACTDAAVLNVYGDCPTFSDKSEWVHLPLKTGSPIYYIRNMTIVENLVLEANLDGLKVLLNNGTVQYESWRDMNILWYTDRNTLEKDLEKMEEETK